LRAAKENASGAGIYVYRVNTYRFACSCAEILDFGAVFGLLWIMRVALTDLDKGLFFCGNGWTSDSRGAQTFASREEARQKAIEQKVKNAAAAIMEGIPQKVAGFVWLTEPCSGPC